MKLIFQGFMDEKVQGGGIRCPPLVHVGLRIYKTWTFLAKIAILTVFGQNIPNFEFSPGYYKS